MITWPKVVKQNTVQATVKIKKSSTHLFQKMIILMITMETQYSQVSHWNFQANVNKIFIDPAKNVWNPIFLPYKFTLNALLLKVVISAHYVKKELFHYITSLLR